MDNRYSAHHEQQLGEVFLGNTKETAFFQSNWKTKRLGFIAYDQTGNIVSGLFPFFVQETEFIQGMASYKDNDGQAKLLS